MDEMFIQKFPYLGSYKDTMIVFLPWLIQGYYDCVSTLAHTRLLRLEYWFGDQIRVIMAILLYVAIPAKIDSL